MELHGYCNNGVTDIQHSINNSHPIHFHSFSPYTQCIIHFVSFMLSERGIYVIGFSYPVVPKGKCNKIKWNMGLNKYLKNRKSASSVQ